MTLPHEQILTRVDRATGKEQRVAICAGCGREKELRIGRSIHKELDGGDMRFVLVTGLGWACLDCALRVYN